MTDTERRIITCLDGLHMALIDTNKILRDLIDPRDGRIHGISNMIVMVQEALGPLLEQLPQYQPSSDDKSPHSATGEANSGTLAAEMHRWNWDRVNGEWFVCESHHSKSSGCEWRAATPEEISVAGKEPNDP